MNGYPFKNEEVEEQHGSLLQKELLYLLSNSDELKQHLFFIAEVQYVALQ